MIEEQAEGIQAALAELAEHGLAVLSAAGVDRQQRQFLPIAFRQGNSPVLTPLAVQDLDPPPLLPGQQWHVAAVLAARQAEGPGERIVVTARPHAVFPLDSPPCRSKASAWPGWKT